MIYPFMLNWLPASCQNFQPKYHLFWLKSFIEKWEFLCEAMSHISFGKVSMPKVCFIESHKNAEKSRTSEYAIQPLLFFGYFTKRAVWKW